MKKIESSISDAIDAALRSNQMEGLELSLEGSEMFGRVKRGEISITELKAAAIFKYTALGRGEIISYETALQIVKKSNPVV